MQQYFLVDLVMRELKILYTKFTFKAFYQTFCILQHAVSRTSYYV